jgi:hypothetical protein
MEADEIAKKICKYTYLKQCDHSKDAKASVFSFEDYWERNKKYFTERAQIYLEVKACLEEKE